MPALNLDLNRKLLGTIFSFVPWDGASCCGRENFRACCCCLVVIVIVLLLYVVAACFLLLTNILFFVFLDTNGTPTQHIYVYISNIFIHIFRFWSPQIRFLQIGGVKRCIVGYCGGQTDNPTYRSIQDYTEAILVEYDPKEITYQRLLDHWSRMHDPTKNKTSCQYRAAVWYVNDEQRGDAEAFAKELERQRGRKVTSAIEPATRFFRAEEYHQNFITKQQW